MDGRSIAHTFLATVLAGGVSAMIGATALPDPSPYFADLMYGGAAAVVVGVLGLVALLLTRPKAKTPVAPPEPVAHPEVVHPQRGYAVWIEGDDSSAHGNTVIGSSRGIGAVGNRNAVSGNQIVAPEGKPPAPPKGDGD